MLDLGTLGVRVQANTGDTVSRLDEVRNSLENLEDKSAASSKSIKSSTTESAEGFEGLSSAVNLATKAASGDISSFVNGGISMFGSLAPAAGIATAAIGGIVDAIKKYNDKLDSFVENNQNKLYEFSNYADTIATDGVITGLTQDFVNLYTSMSGITDVDFSTIKQSIKELNTELGKAINGDSGAIKKFEKLNVAIYGEDGKPRSTEDIYKDVIDVISQLPTAAEQAAVASELFGERAANAMLPLFQNENATYDKLKELADKYNILATDSELSLGTRIQDMKDLKDAAEKTTTEIQSLITADTQIAADEAALEMTAAKTAYFRGEITYDEYLAAMGKSAAANEANRDRAADAMRIKEIIENDEQLAKWRNKGFLGKAWAGIADTFGYGSGTLFGLFGDDLAGYADEDLFGSTMLNTSGNALRFFNPMAAATGEYDQNLVNAIVNSANANNVVLGALDQDWTSELKVMVSDYNDGMYTIEQFTENLNSMFSGLNNEDWGERTVAMTDAIKEGFKDVQINNTVVVDTQSNVSFYDEVIN